MQLTNSVFGSDAQDKNQLIKISDFALMTGTSSKMLKHYESAGLFNPSYIDSLTGYRYYQVSQIPELATVRMLVLSGLSIVTIKEFLPILVNGNFVHTGLKDNENFALIDARIEELENERRAIDKKIESLSFVRNRLTFDFADIMRYTPLASPMGNFECIVRASSNCIEREVDISTEVDNFELLKKTFITNEKAYDPKTKYPILEKHAFYMIDSQGNSSLCSISNAELTEEAMNAGFERRKFEGGNLCYTVVEYTYKNVRRAISLLGLWLSARSHKFQGYYMLTSVDEWCNSSGPNHPLVIIGLVSKQPPF